jgi:peptide/nickel transport system ATP-binding protein
MLTANEIMEWNEAGSATARPLLDVEALSKTFVVKPSGWRTQVWRPWQRATAPPPPSGAGPGASSGSTLGRTAKTAPTLQDISFAVLPGASVGISGAAGSGKSTLARLIMGQLAPDSGSASRTCQVQLMTQDGAAFFPARQTIPQVLAAAFAPQQLPPEAARVSARRLLERVGLAPDQFATDTMSKLSRGQRQRVAVALALVGDPQLIILDEPTAGLGAVAAAPLIELLQDLRVERGLTYLVLSREPDVARALSGSVLSLVDGRLTASSA